MKPSKPRQVKEESLIDLAERALSPAEAEACLSQPASLRSREEAKRLIERWEKLVLARSRDQGVFERRLERMGLDRKSAYARLEQRPRLSVETLPEWASFLGEVLEDEYYPADEDVRHHLLDAKDTDTPLFPEFLHPFVSYFIREVFPKGGEWIELLTDSVVSTISQHVLHRLSSICARSVAHDIKSQTAQGNLQGDCSEERYRFYVCELLGTASGLLNFLCRFPVLGRFLAVVTKQEVVNAADWFARLKSDRDSISETFNTGVPPGMVVKVVPGISDPHFDGKMVWSVTFETGLRLAYKPRSLAVDSAYQSLIEWLNESGITLPLRMAKVVEGDGYGWAEWIEVSELADKNRIGDYFERQGAHLAVFYFLCGTDFHEENFLPDGEWPIPIDLEGIGALALTYAWGDFEGLPVQWRSIPDSVASTCMLPRWWGKDTDREVAVLSPFTGREESKNWPVKRPVWHGTKTDHLRLGFEHAQPKPSTSLPRWRGKSKPVKPDEIERVLRGFSEVYSIFFNRCEEVAGESGPLSAFNDLPTRVLVRSTEEYGHFLFWSTAPDILASGYDYDIALEVICCSRAAEDERLGNRQPDPWKGEKFDLWKRDIPYFEGSTSDLFLTYGDGSKIGPINAYTGFELIQKRLREASEADLNWQSEIIRASLEMLMVPNGVPLKTRDQEIAPSVLPRFRPDSVFAERAEQHLSAIGETLERLAVRHEGGVGWLSMGRMGSSDIGVHLVHPMPWYPIGTAGAAIFLANLGAYTGSAAWSSLAKDATQTVAEAILQYDGHPLFGRVYQNGLYGSAIAIYALLTCEDRLGEGTFRELASRLALTPTVEEWGVVEDPELLNGASASLLLLTKLFQEGQQDEAILQRAKSVSKGLISQQLKDGPYVGAFRNPHTDLPNLGMAHGASGTAYALSSLYEITRDGAIRDSVQAALAFERGQFSQEHQDWPRIRASGKEPNFMSGWCGGAPGIGLARMKMAGRCEDELLPEIEAACEATIRHIGSAGHHLCCGEAGRIIFLVEAAKFLDRPELFQIAQRAASDMLDFYEEKGYWKLQLASARSIIPGLTDGVSGIGLSLLSLLDPDSTSQFLTLS